MLVKVSPERNASWGGSMNELDPVSAPCLVQYCDDSLDFASSCARKPGWQSAAE